MLSGRPPGNDRVRSSPSRRRSFRRARWWSAPSPWPWRKALTKLAELPLVDRPIRPSPCLAWAMTWRTKMCCEADVVGDRSQHGAIGGQVDGGERGPAGGDRVQELDRDVCSIAARAAVAHGEKSAVSPIDLGQSSPRRRPRPVRSWRRTPDHVAMVAAFWRTDSTSAAFIASGPASCRAGTDRALRERLSTHLPGPP